MQVIAMKPSEATILVEVRLTHDEHKRFAEDSFLCGLTIGDLIRQKLFGVKKRIKTEEEKQAARDVIKRFCEMHIKKYQMKYPVNHSKHFTLVNKMIKSFGTDKIYLAMKHYFDTSNPDYGHSIEGFSFKITSILQNLQMQKGMDKYVF